MNRLSLTKKLFFALAVLFLFLITLEIGLRIILFLTPLGSKGLSLDPYEEPDSRFGWRLKPNYHKKVFSPDTQKEEFLFVNSKGFRGKEFNINKKQGVIRIITMGDSVTFGITPENCPYPAQLQKLLDEKYPGQFEVINAGVEGYSSREVLRRLEYDILQYKPDIVTIYVGWNDLYAYNPLRYSDSKRFRGLVRFLNNFYIYKGLRKVIFLFIKPTVNKVFIKQASNQRIEAVYKEFDPIIYKIRLKKIIEIAKENNIRIVLINLASILSDKMTKVDIKKVHYPYFTSDIRMLKILQDRYNEAIKDISKEEGVPLIDIDQAINEIPEKGKLFFDTLHPYCNGQKIIAKIIFDNLINQSILQLTNNQENKSSK